jgi:hypothetical protein
VVIRDAEAAELAVLQDIDVATGQMFRDTGMPEVAEYDPWPLPDLEHSREAGLLWVIPGGAGEPVAFLIGSQVDGCLHVEQAAGGRDRPGPVAAGVHAPRYRGLGITLPRAS